MYVLTGLLGLHFEAPGLRTTLLWAPAGIAVAAGALLGPRALAAVFVGALLTQVAHDGPDLLDLPLALSHTAEAGLALLLLDRLGFQPQLRRRQDLSVWFGGAVLVAPLVGATLGVATLALGGALPVPWPVAAQTWWMGSAAGVLVFSPFLFAWATRDLSDLTRGRVVEIAALGIGAFTACGVGLIALADGGPRTAALVLLPLPFLVWAALRFGQRGTSSLAVGLAAGAVALPAMGAGPLTFDNAPATISVVWTATCAYAIAGLLLSFLNGEQSSTLRALAAEEERLTLATQSARVGVWDWDLRTGRVVHSGESTGMLGLEADEIADTYDGWRARTHPEDVHRLDAAWQAHVRGEADRYEVDVRLRDAGGRGRWVRYRGLIVRRDGRGQPTRAAGTQTDIHEEKVAQLAEVALRRLARELAAATTPAQAAAAMEARIRDLVEAETLALYVLDPDGRTLRPVGPMGAAGSGFHPVSLEAAQAGEDTDDSLDPLYDGPALGRCDQPIRTAEGWVGLLAARGFHGGRPESANRARLAAAADHSAGAILRLRAEQRRAELEQQVLHAQKLESLGVLAGGVAHDFNNMLATILGNTGVALLDLDPAHPAHAPLSDVEIAANRAAELCRGLLAYAGRGRTRTEVIPLNTLVREMERLIDAGRRKEAEIVFELDPGLPAVEGDAAQLRQVVLNLITNASDALGPGGGRILVRTEARRLRAEDLAHTWVDDDLPGGTYVCLRVQDDGTGMAPDVLARIFDPFFTTKFTGRGLGLAAVLGILRSHRGAVQIDSAPGEGTTFEVFLPASDARVEARPDPERTPMAPAGRVLVVDDEPGLRKLVARVMGSAGWWVDQAEDGEEGVERVLAEDGGYDLVVLDLTMPRMGGAEALERMRAHRPGIKVLLTSGYSVDESPRHGPDDPDTGFLPKPWGPDDLHRAVGQLVSGPPGRGR